MADLFLHLSPRRASLNHPRPWLILLFESIATMKKMILVHFVSWCTHFQLIFEPDTSSSETHTDSYGDIEVFHSPFNSVVAKGAEFMPLEPLTHISSLNPSVDLNSLNSNAYDFCPYDSETHSEYAFASLLWIFSWLWISEEGKIVLVEAVLAQRTPSIHFEEHRKLLHSLESHITGKSISGIVLPEHEIWPLVRLERKISAFG